MPPETQSKHTYVESVNFLYLSAANNLRGMEEKYAFMPCTTQELLEDYRNTLLTMTSLTISYDN